MCGKEDIEAVKEEEEKKDGKKKDEVLKTKNETVRG